MSMDEGHFQHDLAAAIKRGYYKRKKQAAKSLLINATGTVSPDNLDNFERGYLHAIHTLITELVANGVPRDKIEHTLSLFVRPSRHTVEESFVNHIWNGKEKDAVRDSKEITDHPEIEASALKLRLEQIESEARNIVERLAELGESVLES